MANLISTSVTDITTASDINNSNRSFQVFQHSHSSGNESTRIVRTGDGWYHWSYNMSGSTGGWPTCPTSFNYFCPIQRQNTGTDGQAYIDVHGTHRGMGGYTQLYRILFSGSSDGAHVDIECVVNGSNRFRFAFVDQNWNITEYGGFTSNTRQNYSFSYGASNGHQSKVPLLFKIYTLCGADEAWNVSVRSSSTSMFPPYRGPTQVAGNVTPSQSTYYV